MTRFWKILAGSALYVLDSLEQPDRTARSIRERAYRGMDDAGDLAEAKYNSAARRVSNISRALRGEDHRMLESALSFAGGMGLGLGLGLLLAPASGDETRSVIADRARDLGQRVKEQFGASRIPPTGTDG